MIARTVKSIKQFYQDMKNENNKSVYRPLYSLVEIAEENKEYMVRIKVKGKNITFIAKPEDILADDNLVNQFSPKDVRALTYLGYLGINRPKYEILAKRLSKDDRFTFVLKKVGEKDSLVKSASEIYQADDILKNMKSEDAQAVAYIAALESVSSESHRKSELAMRK